MRFLALGTILALVWFLALDIVTAALVAGIARACRGAWPDRPAARARFLLALRLLPGVLAACFVLFAFVPIFWHLEPHNTVETVSPLLVIGSLAAVLLVVVAIGRGSRASRQARQGIERWRRGAVPLMIDADLPAAIVAERAATISLVGTVRPRLFVSRPVLDALTPEELQAVIAHEHEHHRSRDNLKRLVMAWWPDALALTATGAWLEREWVRATELAADAAAAGASAARALDLASALVKVARLASVPSSASALHSALHDGGEIAARVRRLAALAEARSANPATASNDCGAHPSACAATHGLKADARPTGCARAMFAAVTIVLLIVCAPHVPSLVQQLTELIVRLGR